MALYDCIFVRVNGQLLMENTSVSSDIESDIAQVKTIPKGFSGITPGSPVRTIEIEEVVPIAGFEFDFETAMLSSQEVEFELGLGSGKSTISKGYLLKVGVSSSIGKTTDSKISFVGTAAAFA